MADHLFDPPTASPSRVGVDETAIAVRTTRHWLYAATDLDTKLLLGVQVSARSGIDPAAEKHDCSETTFPMDGWGVPDRVRMVDLGGHLD